MTIVENGALYSTLLDVFGIMKISPEDYMKPLKIDLPCEQVRTAASNGNQPYLAGFLFGLLMPNCNLY